MNNLTATTISKLIKCTQYETNKADTPNFEAERGSIIHSLIAGVDIDALKQKGIEHKGEYRALFHQHNFEEYSDIANQVKEELRVLREFKHEVALSAKIGDTEITGILDGFGVLDKSGLALIVDWKTGNTRYNLQDKNDSVQSFVYPFLVFENFHNIKQVVFMYVYLDEKDENGRFFYQEELRTYERTLLVMYDYLDKIKENSVSVNSNCVYCAKKQHCQEIQKQTTALTEKPKTAPIHVTKEDVTKAKAIIKVLDSLIETYKRQAPESEFYYKKMYYLDTTKLTDSEKLFLIKDKIHITKEEAKQYNDEAIEEKSIKVMK